MKYKAKDSYKKLKDSENYKSFDSPVKHNRLLAGEEVEIDSPPESLAKHLDCIDKKIKGVKKDG
jgi:hypothetical protein